MLNVHMTIAAIASAPPVNTARKIGKKSIAEIVRMKAPVTIFLRKII